MRQVLAEGVAAEHLAVVLVQSLAPGPQARTNLRNEAIYVLPEEPLLAAPTVADVHWFTWSFATPSRLAVTQRFEA